MPQSDEIISKRITSIRDFHRFYISRVGFLDRKWASLLSLTEARILHEVYIHPATTATEIVSLIAIDGGYLSRLLRKFETAGYLVRKNAVHDKRQRVLSITPKGRKIYEAWSKIAQDNVMSMLHLMSDDEQQRMVDALEHVRELIVRADERAKEKTHIAE